jgi:hypothetical protein
MGTSRGEGKREHYAVEQVSPTPRLAEIAATPNGNVGGFVLPSPCSFE